MKKLTTFILWIPLITGTLAVLSGVEGCSNDSPTGGNNNNGNTLDTQLVLFMDSVEYDPQLFGQAIDSILNKALIRLEFKSNDTINSKSFTVFLGNIIKEDSVVFTTLGYHEYTFNFPNEYRNSISFKFFRSNSNMYLRIRNFRLYKFTSN